MKKFISLVFITLVAALVLSLLSCGNNVGNGNADPTPPQSDGHTHAFDMMRVDDSYLKSVADCSKPAAYFYSCACGDAGTDVFKYASTTPAGWTAVSKTVYGILQGGCIRFEAKDSSMVKLNFDFAQSLTAVSTNGTWYKISMGGSDYGYVRCSHVTDNKGTVTFTDASSKYTDAVVLDGKPGVYLQTDMIGSSSVFVTYEASHDGYISVLEINQTGDWVKVRFNGYDSNGGYHEAKKVFYCQTKDLFLRPW